MKEKNIQVSQKEAYQNAVFLLEKGNFSLAEKQLAEILRNNPNDPNILRLSGVSAIEQGKPEAALIPLKKAVKIAPDFAKAHEDLATAWFLLGDLKESEKYLKKTIRLDPKLFSAWKSLGDILSDQGKEEQASKAYRKALETDNKYSEMIKAMNLVAKGQAGEAEKIYRQILSEDPDNVDALRLLALLASRSGAIDQAITMLRKCTEIAPDYAMAWDNLGKMYRQKEDYFQAIACLQKATELRPEWPQGWAGLGTVYTRASFHEEGIKAYSKSIELKEDQPRVHLSLGHVYKTIGLQKKSIKSYRKTIKLDPQNGEAYWSLANLKTYKFTSKEIKEMLQQLENNDLSDREKVHFQFALGKSYEDQKKFQISFNYYLAGNSLNRGRNTYDPKAIEAMVDREIRFFNKSFFKERIDWGESTIDPIFIVGLPRSGSTLIEQILASHSLVEGTMELPNILNIARKLGNTSREGSNYPEILKKTTKAEAQQLGKKYIEETKWLRSEKPFFIDKMPNNFSHIGLLSLILPKAKIIDARRNPMDTCLSCFKQLFARGQVFSYDLNEIGRYYVNYIRLMDHWNNVIPGKVYLADYEKMIGNQEQETRKLLEFCDLSFEENCLRFYENTRAVKTASSEQVRQPIYKQGINHWKNFEDHLNELKLSLEPLNKDLRFKTSLLSSTV